MLHDRAIRGEKVAGQPVLTTTESLELFPTFIHRGQLQDPLFGQRIADIVAGLHRTATAESANAAIPAFDWTSDANLHAQYTEFAYIADAFGELATSWARRVGLTYDELVVTECWGNVIRPGGSAARHHHRGAYLSGVYYPLAVTNGGDLVFHDPRGARVQLAPVGSGEPGHSVSIPVEPGLMLLFPAWLEHSVGPNLADAERISVACNVVPTGYPSSPRAPRQPRLVVE